MLSALLQVAGVESVGQLKLARNTQESSDTITCPSIHQLLRAYAALIDR